MTPSANVTAVSNTWWLFAELGNKRNGYGYFLTRQLASVTRLFRPGPKPPMPKVWISQLSTCIVFALVSARVSLIRQLRIETRSILELGNGIDPLTATPS